MTDITADWVAELLYKVLGVPEPADKDGTHNGITLLQVGGLFTLADSNAMVSLIA